MSKRRHGDVVPFTALEWNYVKTNLLTNDVDVLKNMLDILNMWESRGGVGIPVVIKLTRVVIQGILFDYSNVNTENPLMESNARMIYGTVLMRFISYLNEICQPPGRLVSVFEATKVVGIPQYIVQMRHDIAHSDLPLLTDLRDGVSFCRNWLWDIHWNQPVDIAITVPGAAMPTQEDEEDPVMVENLKNYMNDYHKLIMNKSKDKNQINANTKKLTKLLDSLKKIVSDNTHFVVNHLFKRLLVNKDQITRSKFKYECDEHGLRAWPIPKACLKFWQPMVAILEDCNGFGVLLNKITQQLSDSSVSFFEKSQYAGWTNVFLNRVFLSEIVLSDYDVKGLINNLLDGHFFFEKNQFTKLLDLLKNRISDGKKAEYLNLWEIKTNAMEIDDEDDEIQILTLDSLTSKPKEKEPVEFEEWGVIPVDTPLGLTKDQSDESLDLELKSNSNKKDVVVTL